MKLKKLVDAYLAALELSRTETDYKTAYAIMKLKQKTQAQFDFMREQENVLAEKYADRDEDGNVKRYDIANIRISDPDKMREFLEKRKDIEDMDVEDVEIKEFHVPAPKSIKPASLEALDGFILFEGVDEE